MHQIKEIKKEYEKKFGNRWKDKNRYLWPEATVNEIWSFIESSLLAYRKEEINFLKRLKLECDVVICDCGSKLKDWDIAMLIKERLSELKDTRKKKE